MFFDNSVHSDRLLYGEFGSKRDYLNSARRPGCASAVVLAETACDWLAFWTEGNDVVRDLCSTLTCGAQWRS